MTTHTDPLVSTEWLAARLGDPKVKIIDASFKMPGVLPLPIDDYLAAHIPGAVFFDIDDICDETSPLPHMLPHPVKFSSRMRKLGLGDGSRFVVYDTEGLYSAARVWWMLRAMGHDSDIFALTIDDVLQGEAGVSITAVLGDERALKITTPEDVVIAQAYIEEQR